MKRFLLFLCCLCLVSTVFAQDANEVKAQNIIKQAREALGGEANLKAIQSLTMQGKFTATLIGRPAQGDLKIEMVLPGKYLRTFSTMQGNFLQCVNAADVWSTYKRNELSMAAGGIGADVGGDTGGEELVLELGEAVAHLVDQVEAAVEEGEVEWRVHQVVRRDLMEEVTSE